MQALLFSNTVSHKLRSAAIFHTHLTRHHSTAAALANSGELAQKFFYDKMDADRPTWISGCCVEYDYDALSEILMRLDPESLFKCVLVSKDWLSVITRPDFRAKYLSKWKDSSSKVVGLLLYDQWEMMCDDMTRSPGLQLLPTSNLGRDIIRSAINSNWILAGGTAFFIAKSPKGSLLLFGAAHPKRFFVCKTISGGCPSLVELPPPPKHYEACMANILGGGDDEGYKVVLAYDEEIIDRTNATEVSIQTYRSQTGKWEQSMLTCSTLFHLDPKSVAEGGLVDSAGVIYWEACNNNFKYLATWDANGGCIRVIPAPPFSEDGRTHENFPYYIIYGVSLRPQGSLLAATCGYPNYECPEFGVDINIWALDDDRRDWCMLHSVHHESVWTNYLALSTPFFKDRPLIDVFRFVSFVPGKSDSVFLGLQDQLFVYHLSTGMLVEHEEYLKYGFEFLRHRAIARNRGESDFEYVFEIFSHWTTYHPLTILDLGIWPSFSPTLQLPHGS